jgi:uncharacterized protein (DUF1810 family)
MTDPDLIRFVEAQAPVYHQATEELTAGLKQTHWMWFVFPQLAGLGRSALAERFAIRNLDQASPRSVSHAWVPDKVIVRWPHLNRRGQPSSMTVRRMQSRSTKSRKS